MKTLKEDWEDYRRMVLPTNLTKGQYLNAQIAFYAGAFTIMKKIRELDFDSEEEALKMLEEITAECIEFITLKESE